MRLVWRAKARRDLRWIIDFISDRNSSGAERLESMILHTVDLLTVNPSIYRPGRLPDTREAVVHPNYIVIYRVATDKVTILAVIHARQKYP